MVNNRDFGLLHNCDLRPAHPHPHAARRRPTTSTSSSPAAAARSSCSPTPAPSPRSPANAPAPASTPTTSPFHDATVPAWRGVPLLPCNKIPISPELTSSVIVMRTGEDNEGVIGLRQTGHPRRDGAGPVRAVHGHQREGRHQLPRDDVLLGRRARPRRPRRARGLPSQDLSARRRSDSDDADGAARPTQEVLAWGRERPRPRAARCGRHVAAVGPGALPISLRVARRVRPSHGPASATRGSTHARAADRRGRGPRRRRRAAGGRRGRARPRLHPAARRRHRRRRGAATPPSACSVFGIGPAILTGSALQALAYDTLAVGGRARARDGMRMLSASCTSCSRVG